ncbi:MAG TPA: leucyl/phenylalanyl-tRNA--protein transferase [Herbaspirillum sp.]|nr:leucyl/phenylalanyl-tRNA--protein transferase [Herbaspirillum sp.]
MIIWLEHDTPFPDPATALTEEDGAAGLLAAGGDLSPQRLLSAYRQGIFPWYSEGQPILWWSTDPRMVLHCDDLKISQSLRKKLRRVEHSQHDPQGDRRWEIRFDCAFEEVIRACAGPRRDGTGTWISEDIVTGYNALHRAGFAHSSEVWLDGALIGGAYGVSIGQMFYGESMFARVSDASKIALVYLVQFLKQQGVQLIDCQQETAHLASLGATPISRNDFLAHLRQAIQADQIKQWKPLALY